MVDDFAVESGEVSLGPEPETRDTFVAVVVHEYVRNGHNGSLVLVRPLRVHIVQRTGTGGYAIRACKINSYNHIQLQPSL